MIRLCNFALSLDSWDFVSSLCWHHVRCVSHGMRRCLVDQLSVGVVCCRLGCGCGSWTNWLVQQFTCCGRQVDTVYFHKHNRTCQLLILSYKICVNRLCLLTHIHTHRHKFSHYLFSPLIMPVWSGWGHFWVFIVSRIRIFIPTFQFMTTYDLGSVVGTHTSIKPLALAGILA